MKIIKKSGAYIECESDDKEWSASIKFDGGIHFNNHYDNCEDDYLYIGDIDEMIKALQDIKEEALKHFGDHWA